MLGLPVDRLPPEVAALLRLDTVEVAAVGAFLAGLSAEHANVARRPDLPNPLVCAVLDQRYRLLLEQEVRQPGYTAVAALAGLRAEILHTAIVAIARAYLRTIPELVAASGLSMSVAADTLDVGYVHPVSQRQCRAELPPVVARTRAVQPTARMIEGMIVLLAQMELGQLWGCILGRSWPLGDVDATYAMVADDAELLYTRAHPIAVGVSELYGVGTLLDEGGLPVADPASGTPRLTELQRAGQSGLAGLYWLTLAHYRATLGHVAEPEVFCPYCHQPLPGDRRWWDRIRTCGSADCERRYHADRAWLARHKDEVEPIVRQHLGLAGDADMHPGEVRATWNRLGHRTRDIRRERAGRG